MLSMGYSRKGWKLADGGVGTDKYLTTESEGKQETVYLVIMSAGNAQFRRSRNIGARTPNCSGSKAEHGLAIDRPQGFHIMGSIQNKPCRKETDIQAIALCAECLVGSHPGSVFLSFIIAQKTQLA